jgi:hypothetical protein
VATAFPSHKYPGDADCVVMGLAGLRLLHGHPPVFFGSLRTGALGAYPAGLLFLLFGASRATLAAGPMVVQILQLAAWPRCCASSWAPGSRCGAYPSPRCRRQR